MAFAARAFRAGPFFAGTGGQLALQAVHFVTELNDLTAEGEERAAHVVGRLATHHWARTRAASTAFEAAFTAKRPGGRAAVMTAVPEPAPSGTRIAFVARSVVPCEIAPAAGTIVIATFRPARSPAAATTEAGTFVSRSASRFIAWPAIGFVPVTRAATFPVGATFRPAGRALHASPVSSATARAAIAIVARRTVGTTIVLRELVIEVFRRAGFPGEFVAVDDRFVARVISAGGRRRGEPRRAEPQTGGERQPREPNEWPACVDGRQWVFTNGCEALEHIHVGSPNLEQLE